MKKKENIFVSGYGALREEKAPQIQVSHSHQLGSNPSIYSGGLHGSQHSTGSLDQVTSPISHHSNKPINTEEDLYNWMAKQQEFIKDNEKGNVKGQWVNFIILLKDCFRIQLMHMFGNFLMLLSTYYIFKHVLSFS